MGNAGSRSEVRSTPVTAPMKASSIDSFANDYGDSNERVESLVVQVAPERRATHISYPRHRGHCINVVILQR